MTSKSLSLKLITVFTTAFAGLFSGSLAQAEAGPFVLTCTIERGDGCFDSENQNQCVSQISLREIERASGNSLSLAYFFSEKKNDGGQKLTRVVKSVSDKGSVSFELASGIPGLQVSWDGAEFWAEFLQTPSGTYVGSITFEEDFPLVVICDLED